LQALENHYETNSAVYPYFFTSLTSLADSYYDATVFFTNGKSRKGLIESTLGTDYILFKNSKDSKEEKIEASTVSRLIFSIKNETREFHILKVYLGWGQKRISDPMWLKVVEKGVATLYVNHTTMTSQNGLNSAGFQDYYVIRSGEPAAKMIANVSSANNNQTFRAKAPLYFEDYPELAAKIKSKEYTWKDLATVIQEYNKWAAKKK
jgi:hypothetical protein